MLQNIFYKLWPIYIVKLHNDKRLRIAFNLEKRNAIQSNWHNKLPVPDKEGPVWYVKNSKCFKSNVKMSKIPMSKSQSQCQNLKNPNINVRISKWMSKLKNGHCEISK